MISRRPSGLTPEQVEAAAEKIYHDIKEGRQIKDVRIVWEVWTEAKQTSASNLQKESIDILELKAIIKDRNGQIVYAYLLTGAIVVAWIFLEMFRWI